MSLPLSSAFTESHRFGVVVFSFSFGCWTLHLLTHQMNNSDRLFSFLLWLLYVAASHFGLFPPSVSGSEINFILHPAAAAKSLQSCPTLCDPIDGSPPGSPVPGILQARTLEWVAISFSNAWKWKVKVKSLSRVWLVATPWTAAYQAPPFMGFSRLEYWSRVPLQMLRTSQKIMRLKEVTKGGSLSKLSDKEMVCFWRVDDTRKFGLEVVT